MKIIALIISSLFIFSNIYSQNDTKYSYLIVKIESDYDKMNDKDFCKISAQPGNPFANEVYGLVKYYTGKKALNTEASYFPDDSDTTKPFFNYFNNATEALLYLAQNKWELVSIFNQITSDYSREGDYPYTKVSSYPVYYFKKEIQ